MKIKRATENDSRTLSEIFSILYKPELRWSEDKIRENIIWGNTEYFLIINDEEFLGGLSLRLNKNECELEAIAIKPRFQRSGVGSQLLEFAENLAKEKECRKIWCYSLESYNIGKFYQKHGWQQEVFIPKFFDNQNCFKYSKKLK